MVSGAVENKAATRTLGATVHERWRDREALTSDQHIEIGIEAAEVAVSSFVDVVVYVTRDGILVFHSTIDLNSHPEKGFDSPSTPKREDATAALPPVEEKMESSAMSILVSFLPKLLPATKMLEMMAMDPSVCVYHRDAIQKATPHGSALFSSVGSRSFCPAPSEQAMQPARKLAFQPMVRALRRHLAGH